MAKYLDKESLAGLDEFRHKIFALRAEAYAKYKIDVLDNDTLSALSIYEKVVQYDPDYNVNFARNGEDAISKGVLIEQKCSRVQMKKRTTDYPSAAFQFHAMGNLDYNRYILVTRDKATLDLVCIYDVSAAANTKLIQEHLLQERNKWLAKGRLDEKKMKHDVIMIPETILVSMAGAKTQTINGCKVVVA
jgi:hypothetical protein